MEIEDFTELVNMTDISAPAVVFSFGFAFQAFWAVLYHKAWRLDLHLNTFLVLFLGVLEFFLVTMFVKFIAHKIKPREYKTKPFVIVFLTHQSKKKKQTIKEKKKELKKINKRLKQIKCLNGYILVYQF